MHIRSIHQLHVSFCIVRGDAKTQGLTISLLKESIARRYGFKLEVHEVTTSDGYILSLYRVVPCNGTIGDTPVLLQHGICNNGAFWMLDGKKSIPFYLVSVGFDVWLSNARGTEVSMRHVNMTAADPKFWDFSFHEIAVFDIPALLDYIRKKTGGKRKVNFMGHSMGGTIQFVYSSMLPDHAKENVEAIVSLAPVVYTKYLKSEVPRILSDYTGFILDELHMIDFYGSGMYPHLKKLVENTCKTYPTISTCQVILESLVGSNRNTLEAETLPLFFRRYPASFSIKTLAHYGQERSSGGRFQMFDYGTRENLLRYNSVIPPAYDLQKIKVPVYILFGEADLLSVEEDLDILFADLKTEKYMIHFRGENNAELFTHNDFLFSKELIKLDQYLAELLGNVSTSANKKR
ncbi:lipase 1-like isoform X2 [Harmonia axyridis]|uniref:lipase 1-like isoform X2 n=1 Tax=Harmonia axyridis TaxID=115357 RepID=UPI001E278029|nr:lipase 1-like isoform X2 [Harmonia axyridis]